jgi:hypothetical protein
LKLILLMGHLLSAIVTLSSLITAKTFSCSELMRALDVCSLSIDCHHWHDTKVPFLNMKKLYFINSFLHSTSKNWILSSLLQIFYITVCPNQKPRNHLRIFLPRPPKYSLLCQTSYALLILKSVHWQYPVFNNYESWQ